MFLLGHGLFYGRSFHFHPPLPTLTSRRLLNTQPPPLPKTPRILYEDRDFVFVDKPSGMATVGTDIEINLHNWIKEKYGGQFFLPHVLHVLDRVASGVLVFGKHRAAENHFHNLKITGGVVYGVVVGIQGKMKPFKGKVKANIMKTPKDMRRFSLVRRGGKPVELDFICLSKFRTDTIVTATDPIVTTTDPIVTATPIVTTTDPIVTATDPIVTAKTVKNPIVTATNPIVTATNPIVTTTNPIVTATNPIETTTNPIETTTNPTVTSTYPTVTSTDPIVTTAAAVVAINNITERQHQVRAACSAMNIPIVGDRSYGGINFPMTLYHGCYIKFPKFLQEGEYEIISIPENWPMEYLTKVTPENIKLVWGKNFREEFVVVPIGKQRSFNQKNTKIDLHQ